MAENQRAILVQATLERQAFEGKLVVRFTNAGETEEYVLVDDGSVEGDTPMDGLWTAYCPVGPGRFFDVALKVLENQRSTIIYHRLINVPPGDGTLDFYVEARESGYVAHRVAWLPAAGDDEYHGGPAALTLAFGWGLLVLVYVFLLIRTGHHR